MDEIATATKCCHGKATCETCAYVDGAPVRGCSQFVDPNKPGAPCLWCQRPESVHVVVPRSI